MKIHCVCQECNHLNFECKHSPRKQIISQLDVSVMWCTIVQPYTQLQCTVRNVLVLLNRSKYSNASTITIVQLFGLEKILESMWGVRIRKAISKVQASQSI